MSWCLRFVELVTRQLSHTGVACRIRYEVQPVDDMERMSGPPYWLDLEDCRYYISQRVAPDPETRRIWEHNEAEAAIATGTAAAAVLGTVVSSAVAAKQAADDEEGEG